jgi:mRNA interferase MazF
MLKQGDIVIVKFPFTDGSEFKKRPALIISNNLVNVTGDFLLIQITSKKHKDELSLTINKNDCSVDLPLKSYIRTHKIFTVNESLISSKLSSVTSAFLKNVVSRINHLIETEKTQ